MTDWDIINPATTEISVQLGSDPASEAVRDHLWRARDPKGRKMDPMPAFIATGVPDAAELERLMIGVANASAGSPEEREAVVEIIHVAFQSAKDSRELGQ